MSTEVKKWNRSPAKAADRRKAYRYKFSAVIDVAESAQGKRLRADLSDLSQQGCRIATSEPFPMGTIVDVRITKGDVSVAAQARVAFAVTRSGMDFLFTSIEPEPLRILSAWVSEARESAWIALSRRRSQRVMVSVPLKVMGKNALGAAFEEATETVAISAHGALLLLSKALSKGHSLTLFNVRTGAAAECIVVHIGESKGPRVQIGVEFLLPSSGFWHVAFPPKDWSLRHADVKKSLRAVSVEA